jgi:hypothetical protein
MTLDDSILDSPISLPEHVVSRAFEKQTVLLNLDSGNYHGLNPVAVRMLEASTAAETPRHAVPGLASEYDQPESVIEADLEQLIQGLADRGLVVIDSGDGG